MSDLRPPSSAELAVQSANGRGGPDRHWGTTPGGWSQQDIDLETTRYLSAATQLQVDYAELVASRVIGEPLRALAPAFGVDVVVVTRWALESLRLRWRRDLALLAILALGVVLSWVLTPVWLIVMLMAAWLVISYEQWVRRNRNIAGKLLHDRFDPANAPPPPSAAARDRLEEVARRRDGNLVVFRDRKPFVGSSDVRLAGATRGNAIYPCRTHRRPALH